MAVVLPEKRGVHVGDDGEHCSAEILRANDREQRVASAVRVVEQLHVKR